jgi:putative FmdB family regulatory protein
MPIYEFQCPKCQHIFEELVFGRNIPVCPACGGKDAEKLISRPARSASGRNGGDDMSSDCGGGGCASCSGGNCAGCGH